MITTTLRRTQCCTDDRLVSAIIDFHIVPLQLKKTKLTRIKFNTAILKHSQVIRKYQANVCPRASDFILKLKVEPAQGHV
ncbi:hypothetical protein CHS0354_002639, partial [Potamilus streckersoni]